MDLTLHMEQGRLNIRVAAWIEHEDNILCATFPDGTVSLPGGRVKFGETTAEAVIREIYEETGEQLLSPQIFAIIENFYTIEQQHFHEYLYLYKGQVLHKSDYVTDDLNQIIHWITSPRFIS